MHKTRPNPCSDISSSHLDILKEIAKMQMGQGLDYNSKIMDEARKKAVKRFEEAQRRKKNAKEDLNEVEANRMQKAIEEMIQGNNLEEVMQNLSNDGEHSRLTSEIETLEHEPQQLVRKDFDDVLSQFHKKGITDSTKPKITLTSKGARLLGHGYLNRILQKLSRQGIGPHKIDDIGHGPWHASTIRPYEVGDPYARISFELSILATLERGVQLGDFNIGDFRVWEAIHSTEIQFGIIVDQSASMARSGKLEAAVQTGLALSELMRTQFPEDTLHLYAFSEKVRKVRPWEITSQAVPAGYTDITAALKRFRREVASKTGNKQAHLITDSAPNYENGEYVGFLPASKGLIEEAKRYRIAGIVLNIIMLDETQKFRDMAKEIARQNLGRVFFMKPGELGEAVVEDYLIAKKDFIKL